MIFKAQCSCGAVRLEASGEPVVQCYCHCNSCRSYTGAPVSAPVLWPRASVRFTAGEDHVDRYARSGAETGGILTCQTCHGLVGIHLAGPDLFDIYAGLLSDFEFRPTVHLNYENAVLKVRDGLPKLKDMPEDWGGSGEILPE
ncbi:GFA family protein [Roseobacter ponti]|uniref:GFA family protein n=1 Tax=Roseobacter ponti TaxID=1891787 RepID=A0A858STX3_9RHOB|nr:GFA family protein [Roseobacter ponti]QJF51457.1 GFA family protein [Roseobacter ponti]